MINANDTPQTAQPVAEFAVAAADAVAPATPAQSENPVPKDWKAPFTRFLPLGAAAVIGILAGAGATSAFYELSVPKDNQQPRDIAALSEAVRRLDTNVSALSTTVGSSTKVSSATWAKIAERFDKVEKSMAEPNSRLAALTDSVEKLRAAAPAKVVAADVTGTIPTTERAPAEPQKPVLGNWTLHEVVRGVATVESRIGVFDVMTGDSLPGLDRVEAIRKQDGKWVVVTRKGVIVAR